jgi:hypothetical protein
VSSEIALIRCPAMALVGAAVSNVRNDGPKLVAPAADLFTA